MRLFLVFIPLAVVSASWFGSDSPSYSSWSTEQLKDWLVEHHIPVPTQSSTVEQWHQALQSSVEKNWNSASSWTEDQYTDAQKTFSSLREDTFESWDESRLREWLLEQGIVSPKSKREELVLLAKQRYRSYLQTANDWSKWASDAASATSASASSYAAAATTDVANKFDDAKDYVYSTWDDNRLRSYLEEKGLIKTKQEKKRNELLKLMHDAYAKTANPIWDAWSTSYMHSWLVSHNLISPTPSATEQARQALVDKMNQYYYSVNDYVWDSWTDSQLRSWLVDNGVVKEKDASSLSRDKLLQKVSNSYNNASSTISSAWTDSQIREWLVSHGYLQTSDAEKVKRGDLVKLFKEKLPQSKDPLSLTQHPYVAWPTPRLRAYLIESGVKESDIPKTREELLWRVSYKWDSAKGRTSDESKALFTKVQSMLNSGVEKAEDTLSQVWEVLTGYYQSGVEEADEKERRIAKEFREKEKQGQKKAASVKEKVENEL